MKRFLLCLLCCVLTIPAQAARRIPSGTTDQVIYFKMVDSTDHVTAETGLTTFTVYRSRNGGSAAAMTTPTVSEVDATNMPGVYSLLLDEDTSLTAGNVSEEMLLTVKHAGADDANVAIELFRPTISDVKQSLECKPGIPLRITADFGTTPTTTTIERAGQAVLSTEVDAPTWQQHGSTSRYTGNLIVQQEDELQLFVYDADGHLLYQADVSCQQATDIERQMGLQNAHNGPVTIWPENIISGTSSNDAAVGTNSSRLFFSYGRTYIPYDCDIGLVEIHGNDDWEDANITEVRVFTGYWTDKATLKFRVRSVSEDIKNDTPYAGSRGTFVSWWTAKLNRVLRAQRGDFLGIVIYTGGAGGTDSAVRRFPVLGSSPDLTGVNKIYQLSNTFDPATEMTAAVFASLSDVVGIRPIIEPPAIAIAGDSRMAGVATFTDNITSTEEYSSDDDPAGMIADRLGLPGVCNIAVNGSQLAGWVNANTGYHVTVIDPLRPAILIYNSGHNERSAFEADAEAAADSYISRLDRLLSICDTRGITLVLTDTPGNDFAVTNNFDDSIRRVNEIQRSWCLRNGVPLIPAYFRMGQVASGATDPSSRDAHRTPPLAGAGYLDYGDPDNIHESLEGMRAKMTILAAAIKQGLQPYRQNAEKFEVRSNLAPLAAWNHSTNDIRTELTPELAFLDAAVSSRNSTTPPTTTEINAAIEGGQIGTDLTEIKGTGFNTAQHSLKANQDTTLSGTASINNVNTIISGITEDDAGTRKIRAAALRLPSGETEVAAAGSSASNLDEVSGGGGVNSVIQLDPDPDCVIKMGSRRDGNHQANNPARMRVGEQPVFAFDVDAILDSKPTSIVSITATAADGSATTDLVVSQPADATTGVRDYLVIGKATTVATAGTYKIVAVIDVMNGSRKKIEGEVIVKD